MPPCVRVKLSQPLALLTHKHEHAHAPLSRTVLGTPMLHATAHHLAAHTNYRYDEPEWRCGEHDCDGGGVAALPWWRCAGCEAGAQGGHAVQSWQRRVCDRPHLLFCIMRNVLHCMSTVGQRAVRQRGGCAGTRNVAVAAAGRRAALPGMPPMLLFTINNCRCTYRVLSLPPLRQGHGPDG